MIRFRGKSGIRHDQGCARRKARVLNGARSLQPPPLRLLARQLLGFDGRGRCRFDARPFRHLQLDEDLFDEPELRKTRCLTYSRPSRREVKQDLRP